MLLILHEFLQDHYQPILRSCQGGWDGPEKLYRDLRIWPHKRGLYLNWVVKFSGECHAQYSPESSRVTLSQSLTWKKQTEAWQQRGFSNLCSVLHNCIIIVGVRVLRYLRSFCNSRQDSFRVWSRPGRTKDKRKLSERTEKRNSCKKPTPPPDFSRATDYLKNNQDEDFIVVRASQCCAGRSSDSTRLRICASS